MQTEHPGSPPLNPGSLKLSELITGYPKLEKPTWQWKTRNLCKKNQLNTPSKTQKGKVWLIEVGFLKKNR